MEHHAQIAQELECGLIDGHKDLPCQCMILVISYLTQLKGSKSYHSDFYSKMKRKIYIYAKFKYLDEFPNIIDEIFL